ncbi:PREDICTED: dystrobrevin beta [Ceratosolen solmsi marchali]|uniref:Dystrobrevin beta n=1 Tax=Ceratosolen solmsi marchali TaxID=326594 RepID=A0AAJ7E2D8_9HYME|nr:PREDICTED: dystrobrevin beta [Ceratosolen solmsi marchali]
MARLTIDEPTRVEMAEDAVSGSGAGSTSSCSGSNNGGSISGETSRLQLLQEMRKQNFDSIRFASYRTACKMRFIQKKVNLHNVDIWNVIEAFRENSLNTLEPSSTLSVSRLETLLSSLFHALNKRMPISQQAKVDATTALLMNWLLAAYTSGDNNKISVFSVKVALATLCAGKLMDKFRYIYSQISDGNGHMIHWRFTEYLKEVLALPAALYESPSFGYSNDLGNSIFPSNAKITVNDFLDTLMSEPGPHCLIWLPLYHRMASVECVTHPIACDACHRENFNGFRYRCQRCHSYQLCQDCFWRGKVSGTHSNDHETREYSSFKSPSKQIGHSLRKSFRCVPDKGRNNLPRFPEQPEKTLDLSHIVPPSPLPSHNGFPDSGFMGPFDSGSLDSRSTLRSSRLDDEHKLIAMYAQRLSQETRTVPRTSSRLSQVNQTSRTPSDANLTSLDASRAQRELISQLEAKNKEIMREIARLRRQQEIEAAGLENPALMSELRALRQRKDELENHLATLQDSRRQLMVQLEGLMKMLKIHQASPRSTPNSSPRSTKSPPLIPGPTSSSKSAPATPGGSLSIMPNHQQQHQQMQQQMSRSYQSPIPPTPMSVNVQTATNASIHGSIQNTSMPDNLSCVGGDVRSAFRTNSLPGSSSNSTNNSLGRSLRNDLLIAADNVTNAMSSLVRELNSDSDEEDQLHNSGHHNIKKPLDFEIVEDDESTNDTSNWREELQRRYQEENNFLSELRARNNTVTIQSHSHQQTQHHNQLTSKIQYSNQNPNQNQHQVQHQNHNTNNYNQNNQEEQDHYQQHQNEYEEAEDEKRNENEIEWSEAVKRWINR